MNEYAARYNVLTEKLLDLAKSSPSVRAIFIVGSKTRANEYNDRWSDIDYIIFTNKKEKFLNNGDWLATLGNPLTKIKQTTAGGDIEWSVSFDDGTDADFVFTSNSVRPFIIKSLLLIKSAGGGQLLKKPLFQLGMAASLYRAGYSCVYDLDGAEKTIRELLKAETTEEPITPEIMAAKNAGFWHYLERAVRKYRRGEYCVVRSRIDGLVHGYVYQLLEMDELRRNPGKKIWHDGKLIETWIDAKTNGRLGAIYEMGTKDAIKNSIVALIDLYQEIFESVYRQYHFEFDYGNAMKLKALILDTLRENS